MQEMADMSAGEMQVSIAASSMFPGFRFSPTDLELISHYLKKKVEGTDKCVEVIPEVEICQYEPWDLPAKSVIQSENEWFFFSPRGRKYPNGSQSKRATESGYWKATGKERNVKSGSNLIGTKRTLVFHKGRAPRGERTEWIMHEYCMRGQPQDSWVVCRIRKNSQFRSNDSPRQGSLNRTNLSTENNSNFSLSEAGVVEESGIFEGTRAVESNSKACSSSYSSHSVEQQCNYESESDQKLTSNYSQPGPSHQGCEDEDCYADILKDDIIDLGQSLMPSTSNPLSISYQPTQAIPSRTVPSQGTANRRIKLRKPNAPEKYHRRRPEDKICDNYCAEESVHPNSLRSPKSVRSLVSESRVNPRYVCYCIFLLIVSILMVLFISFPGHVKRLLYASLE